MAKLEFENHKNQYFSWFKIGLSLLDFKQLLVDSGSIVQCQHCQQTSKGWGFVCCATTALSLCLCHAVSTLRTTQHVSVSRLSLWVLGVSRTLALSNTPCLSLPLLLLFLLLLHHPSAARTFLSVKAKFPIYQRPNCVKEDDSSEPRA